MLLFLAVVVFSPRISLVGGYGILPYPRHPLKSSHRIHRIHGSFWRRIFSHRFHRIHRSLWRRIFSHGIHGIHGMLGCVIGGVGMAGCHTLLICVHLCLSVGGTSLPECSVCSAYSVGHSLPVCLFMSVVVFSHGIHVIHVMLGCVIGGVGMAGMPYPPNLCASVPICGRLSLPEGSVCSACSVGHSLHVCLFMSVVVFSHGIHGMLGCVIGGVGMAGCHTLLICAHLCLSVGGFLCQKVLCVLRILWDTLSPSAWLVQLGWCT